MEGQETIPSSPRRGIAGPRDVPSLIEGWETSQGGAA